MKKRICATLLSSCLVIGAERNSDASIIGKVLKYGSVSVATVAHIATLYLSVKLYKNKEVIDAMGGMISSTPCVGNYLEFLSSNFCYKTIGIVNLLDLWLIDSLCMNLYTLGKYLDRDSIKSNANQEKNSGKEKGESKNDGNNGNNNSKGIGNNNLKSVKS